MMIDVIVKKLVLSRVRFGPGRGSAIDEVRPPAAPRAVPSRAALPGPGDARVQPLVRLLLGVKLHELRLDCDADVVILMVEQIGGIAFVVACTLGAGVALSATGWARGALPAVAVVAGSIGLWQYHVFRPEGPVAMLLLAAGWGAFVVLVDRRRPVPA